MRSLSCCIVSCNSGKEQFSTCLATYCFILWEGVKFMKKLYRTTSIVGFALMSIPLLFTFQYVTQPSHISYLGFAIVSFLLAGILLSFNVIDIIKLNSLKKNGQCFSLKIISLAPIKVLHVRGFYTFRIISEYKDGDGIKHKIHTVAYSVLDFFPHSNSTFKIRVFLY